MHMIIFRKNFLVKSWKIQREHESSHQRQHTQQCLGMWPMPCNDWPHSGTCCLL